MPANGTTFICNTFHNPWVLRDCVMTLADNAPCPIIVVAHDASDDERRVIERVLDFSDLPATILYAGNVHPPAGFNEAVKYVKTEFVALFNDDVLFTRACDIWERLEGSCSLPGVGMVGAATNCAATAESLLTTGQPDVFETPFLTGGGHFMRAELYRVLGGYDEQFTALGGYWDIDLCMRVRQYGLSLLVDRRAYYHHSGSQTIVQTPNRALLGEEAVMKLIKKHGIEACKEWVDHAFCDPTEALKEAVTCASAF